MVYVTSFHWLSYIQDILVKFLIAVVKSEVNMNKMVITVNFFPTLKLIGFGAVQTIIVNKLAQNRGTMGL